MNYNIKAAGRAIPPVGLYNNADSTPATVCEVSLGGDGA